MTPAPRTHDNVRKNKNEEATRETTMRQGTPVMPASIRAATPASNVFQQPPQRG